MTLPNRCNDELYITYTAEMECIVTPDWEGNLTPYGGAEVMDVGDYTVWCHKHGRLVFAADYLEHGVSIDWELI